MKAIDIINKRKELWISFKDIEKDKEYIEAVANKLIDDANLRKEIQDNPELLIEMCFVIVNKKQETVPFFLNEVQHSFINDLNKAIEDYKAGRRLHLNFLVLKGRQQGFTSVITAYQLAKTITTRNFSGMTITDSSDNTHSIFEDKAKYPYNQLPELLKPTEKFNNRMEFHFDKLNSRWRVNTAGNKEVGRSKTINFFHGSESAFWDSIKKIMTGLGQALTKDSIKILETTANGFNEYRTLWNDAEEGLNNWEPKFYEWWKTPEYIAPFESSSIEQEFKNNVINEAKESFDIFKKINWLRIFHNLSWEQLYWYYNKYKDLGEEINQEYPCTPEESFLATGRNVFDKQHVLKRLEEVRKKNIGVIGYLEYKDNKLQFVENNNGYLIVYEKPKKVYPYVIGGDIAEGIKDGDYTVSQVINNVTLNQAARWRGHIDPKLNAREQDMLAKYYNNALIVDEVNNHGRTTIEALKDLGNYHQYKRELIDNIAEDKQDKFGYATTPATRPLLIDEVRAFVRDHIDCINDIDTLKEMLTFVFKENGKAEHEEGEHDDTILALAIALKGREQQSMRVKEVKKKARKKKYSVTGY